MLFLGAFILPRAQSNTVSPIGCATGKTISISEVFIVYIWGLGNAFINRRAKYVRYDNMDRIQADAVVSCLSGLNHM